MNILIIRVSAIGDVVHTLPAIFLLKRALPHAKIHWLVQAKAASIIKDQPFLEHVWQLPDKFFAPHNLITTLKTIRSLKKIKWDAIIDFQGLLKTSLVLAPLKGPKFGFDSTNARWKQSTWFTTHHTMPVFKNIIQKNLALAADVITHLTHAQQLPTLATLEKDFKLTIPANTQTIVNAWISSKNAHNIIALCPNTTWESKHWPLEYWQELCTLLTKELPSHTLILIGQHRGEQASQLAAWAQQNNISLIFLPDWNLLAIAHFLTKIKLLIAPDTGILHIADFLGTPSLGIFGPTSKDKHGPFLITSNQTNAIQIDCSHYYQKSHGQNNNCMYSLTPSMLCTRIKNIL